MYREISKIQTRHSGKENSYTFQIDVLPVYLEDESKPEQQQFIFGYRVTIKNLDKTPAQLISRRWIITDGTKAVRNVDGPGVIGQQPLIEPDGVFEYSSFCPLPTPTGNMRGSYQMMGVNNEPFEIKIPLFFFNAQNNPSLKSRGANPDSNPSGTPPTIH